MDSLSNIDKKIDELTSIAQVEKVQASIYASMPNMVQSEQALAQILATLGKPRFDTVAQLLDARLPEIPVYDAALEPQEIACTELKTKIQAVINKRLLLAAENADLATKLQAIQEDVTKCQSDLQAQNDLLKEAKDEARKLMFESVKGEQ